MTFKLYLLALLLFISGVQRLWVHFADLGLPSSAGEVLNSQVLLGLFGLSVGLGLIRRRPLARTSALAIVFLGVIGAPLVIAYLFLSGGIGAFIFLFHFISQFSPSMASDMTALVGTLGVSLVLWFLLCWIFIRDLLSEHLREEFDEDLWFGRELVFGPVNLKVFFVMGLIGLLTFFDDLVPKDFHRTLRDKHTQQAIEYFQQLPEVQERVAQRAAQAQKDEEHRREVSRSVTLCHFSADERTLLLIGFDGSLHRVNLATGEIAVSQLATNSQLRGRYQGSQFRLGPDGDSYYEATTDSVRRASDPTFEWKVPSPKTRQFLTFGQTASEIVFFNSSLKSFEKFQVGSPEPIWVLQAPFEQLQDWGYLWQSSDLNWLYVAGRGTEVNSPIHSLLRLDRRQIQVLPIEFRFRELGWSAPMGDWMVLSGPVAFDQKYNSYRIHLPSQRVERIAELKPSGALWVSSMLQGEDLDSRVDLRFGQPGPSWARNLSAAQSYSVVGHGRWAVFLRNGLKHASLFDLTNQEEQLVLGQVFAEETVGVHRSCMATSRSQSLVAVVVGRQLQVFWTSEFGKTAPASFAATLELAPISR